MTASASRGRTGALARIRSPLLQQRTSIPRLDEALSTAPPCYRERSALVGTCEKRVCRYRAKPVTRLLKIVAEVYDRESRAEGAPSGALGHIGVEVLGFLGSLIRADDPVVAPSYRTICAKLRRSTDAVARAIRKLVNAGFLLKQRRKQATDHVGDVGPQMEQATNCYRIMLPPWALSLAMTLFGPMPEDLHAALRDVAADHPDWKVEWMAFIAESKVEWRTLGYEGIDLVDGVLDDDDAPIEPSPAPEPAPSPRPVLPALDRDATRDGLLDFIASIDFSKSRDSVRRRE